MRISDWSADVCSSDLAGTGKSEFDDDLRGIANDLGGRDRAGGDEAATDQRMNVSVEGGQQGFTGSGHRKTSGKNGVAVYTGGPDELFGSGKYAVRSSLKMASSPSIRSLHDHSGRTVTNDSLVPIPLMPSAAHGAEIGRAHVCTPVTN